MSTTTLTYFGELVATTCWCGIGVAIPKSLHTEARERRREVYCPLGHTFIYGDNDELARLKRQLEFERDLRVSTGAERDQLAARLRSTRGVVTKLRKRAHAGTCPFGCRRHFADLERHVASKHPGERFENEDAASPGAS